MEEFWWTAPGWSLLLIVLLGECVSLYVSKIRPLICLKHFRILYSSHSRFVFSDLHSSRSESYWTAVVGEFDITKTDPDEQVLKVNRIIPHPKVTIHIYVYICSTIRMI